MANEFTRDCVLPFEQLNKKEREDAYDVGMSLQDDDQTRENLVKELQVTYGNFKTASDEKMQELSEKKKQVTPREFNEYLKEKYEDVGGPCVQTIKSHLKAWEKNGGTMPKRLTKPREEKLRFVGAKKVGDQVHIDVFHIGWEVTLTVAVDIPA